MHEQRYSLLRWVLRFAFVPVCCCAVAFGADDIRTWTDSTGKYTLQGSFIKLEDGKVYLKQVSGAEMIIPLDKLSAADAKQAKTLANEKQEKAFADEKPAKVPPNVVLFLVDSLGWQDTSVPFHTQPTPLNAKYRTPNMERLAKDGMKFTQAYACTVGGPARISLMTGLNAARHGITNGTFNKNSNDQDAPHQTIQPPQWNVNGLSNDPKTERAINVPTLPRLFGAAGYRTILVGKAQFGALGTPGADPKNLGLDVNIGGHAAGTAGSYLGEQSYSNAYRGGGNLFDVPGLEKYHKTETFLTEALTLEANKEIDRAVADRKPFYLYMAHYAVHSNGDVDKRFFQKYRDAGLSATEAMYASMVEGVDKSLGDILDNLDRHKIANETIVIFMSSNGGTSPYLQLAKPNTHNAPLSGVKGSAREGGIRVPMLVKWPGVTAAGSTTDKSVMIDDFLPSLLDMTGITAKLKKLPKMDGISFVPLLRGGADAERFPTDRPLYWHYPNVLLWESDGSSELSKQGIGPSSTVRKGDWKLIYYHAGPRYELFNIANDLSETQNLFETEKAKAKELASLLAKWLKETGAKMPTDKKTGRLVPLP